MNLEDPWWHENGNYREIKEKVNAEKEFRYQSQHLSGPNGLGLTGYHRIHADYLNNSDCDCLSDLFALIQKVVNAHLILNCTQEIRFVPIRFILAEIFKLCPGKAPQATFLQFWPTIDEDDQLTESPLASNNVRGAEFEELAVNLEKVKHSEMATPPL
ncbi:hypothetical protein RUM43_002302 [Polyplax serrata]|uniref:Uncharacterized protein n=1 Tax=Polyplax serrata TaxID=468196 RepID=A0AAN8PDN7_POLSC